MRRIGVVERETTFDGLEVLSADECRRLLSQTAVGRLAMVGDRVPELRPVNYVLEGDAVVVRTGEGRILQAARRGEAAALEIDDVDPLEHTGWSVIVTGTLRERTADEGTRALPLRAWGSGAKDRFVSVAIETVSGRRIPSGKGNR